MGITIYNKLVRDKIPSIIHKTGGTCITSTLSDKEYLLELDKKLMEELQEYQESKSLEELADICEVIRCIVKARGWSIQQLESKVDEKATKRGTFYNKVFLESTDYPDK